MTDLPTTTCRAIDARRLSLARAVVARQYERRPDLAARYGEHGQTRCVQDVDYHLAHLSVAVATATPALFANYLAWAQVVLAARNVRAEDVAESLDCLAEVLRAELPGGAGALAADYVDQTRRALPEVPADVPGPLDGDDPLSALARQYVQALLGGDRHAAGRLVLDALDGGVPVRDVYLGVFQRAQQEVGRLWQLNRLSVAQEHYCTAATRALM
ncbi:MAG TPA: B12-binding domain-containing protein, partial [Gemmataceae bacterium]|nr:B12-binding domain-containing protein [Gemmataceae bacterium]